MVNNHNVAEILRRYRLEREWTYRQLANTAQIPLTTLHGIMRRGQTPNELTMHKLIKAFPGLFELETA